MKGLVLSRGAKLFLVSVLASCFYSSGAVAAQSLEISTNDGVIEHDMTCEFGSSNEGPICQSGYLAAEPSPDVPAPLEKPKPEEHYLGSKVASALLSKDKDSEYVDVIIDVATATRFPALSSDPGQRAAQWKLVVDQRALERQPVENAIGQFGGTVADVCPQANAIVARVPFEAVGKIAELTDVVHIMPRYVSGYPPDLNGIPDDNELNDVDDGRSRIHSDPFSAFGSSGIIATIDTGVRRKHQLLFESDSSQDNRIRLNRDCVCGGADCEDVGNPGCTYTTEDVAIGTGHGTKTACILSGRSTALGARYIGVTSAKIDSWRVYPSNNAPVDAAVVCKAVDRAVYHGARVIAAELQLDAEFNSPVAAAFDQAFDQGVIVVSANGNFGYTKVDCSDWPINGSVRCPANAHKVIGVGYYNVENPSELACGVSGDGKRQSLGPTTDDRVKPDIRMPTHSETGCNLTNGCIDLFSHTSGATPYAAGAALLLYNFFNANQMLPSPGKIYAALLAFGHSPELPYIFQNLFGADQVRLGEPTGSRWMTGVRYVSNGENEDFMFPVNTGHECDLHAAIWWPETATGSHSDVDLYIYNGAGVEKISSTDDGSVFERGNIEGPLTQSASSWRFRMHGTNVPSWATVYYFLYYRTNCN